jgi:two-component system, NarL family, sensor histidine kinase DesK
VTNVVRHSGAGQCTVRLVEARVDGAATLTLEVRDDGPVTPGSRPGPIGSGGAQHPGPGWGNGLTGLSERLCPLRAVLTAEPVWPHGFRVAATVPLEGAA